MGLGVEWYRCLTSLHVAEDMMKDDFPVRPYLKKPIAFNVRDKGGRSLQVSSLIHDNHIYRHMNPLRIRKYLVNSGIIKEMTIQGIPMFAVDAEELNGKVVSLAKKRITIYG